MSFLQVSNVAKKGIDGFILKDITFRQRRQQKIAIAGETGSGKSSLLKIIAGLLEPDFGNVVFEGGRVDGRDKLVPGHPDIAYLAQDFELPKSLRVEQVLEYARKQSMADLVHLFEICNIQHLLKRKTNELSGGERQRVAIARLLTGLPKLLLLDEPYTNLDRIHKLLLKQVLDGVTRLGISCVMISHEPQELLSWADSLIILRHGKIMQRGSPQHVYHSPRNAYVASLLGTYTLMSARTPGFGPSVHGSRFVRPESLKLAEAGVAGIVTATRFLGSHYEIEVNCDGLKVTLAHPDGRVKVNDHVHVRLIAQSE